VPFSGSEVDGTLRASNIVDIACRAASYDVPGVIVDGNDTLEVYRVMCEAVARARRGISSYIALGIHAVDDLFVLLLDEMPPEPVLLPDRDENRLAIEKAYNMRITRIMGVGNNHAVTGFNED
jgi:hypothetical protein